MKTFDEYQEQARRTCPEYAGKDDKLYHAIFGLCSEAGEAAGILQKKYQGHKVDMEHLIRELGDCLWMISEACDALGTPMEQVAKINILKLLDRYPDGFSADNSLHRKDGDI